MSYTSPADPSEYGSAAPTAMVEIVLGGHHHRKACHRDDIAKSPAGAITASRLVVPGDACVMFGWAIRETTAAAGASFRLWDGNAAGTELLANCNLASNESDRDWFGPQGIVVQTGRIFIEVVSGSLEGVVYWA